MWEAEGRLWKAPAAGGDAVSFAEAPPRGILASAWGPDDRILLGSVAW